MNKCRSCGAEIIWITTKKGRPMPCDAQEIRYDEAEAGTTLITLTGEIWKVHPDTSFPNVKGYESHFATCTESNKWRKSL